MGGLAERGQFGAHGLVGSKGLCGVIGEPPARGGELYPAAYAK